MGALQATVPDSSSSANHGSSDRAPQGRGWGQLPPEGAEGLLPLRPHLGERQEGGQLPGPRQAVPVHPWQEGGDRRLGGGDRSCPRDNVPSSPFPVIWGTGRGARAPFLPTPPSSSTW